MPPPLYILCVPGCALVFLIQILLCRAYHFHVTLARNKHTRKSRSKPKTPNSAKLKSEEEQMKSQNNRTYLSGDFMEVELQRESSHELLEEGPSAENSQRTRRKSVFAESYDPSQDVSVEKIIYPKTPEEREWLIENVRNITLFKHLANDQVTTVVDAMHKRTVDKGDVIVRQGDKGSTFYIIQTGVFNVYRQESKDDDRDKLVHTYDNEGSFGELALLYNQPRAATVMANSAGVLWAVDGTTFRRIVNRISYKKRIMYESLINNVQALKALESHEIANLVDVLVPMNFEHDEQIIKQGDKADGMYFIISGGVKIVLKTPQGKDVLLKELSSSEYFGELALLTNNPRAASAYAMGPTHLAFLERETFERLLGPCMNILRRQIDGYSTRLTEVIRNSDI